MIKIGKTGQWVAAARTLGTGPARLRIAMDRATLQEAEFFRKKVVEGIVKQAPGGKAFKPLSETTLAIRRFTGFAGTKALIVRGDLRNSIKVTKKNGPLGVEAFVGVHRTERGSDGEKLVNIAAVHEFGAGPIVIPVTPAMRRFLMAAFSAELPGFGEQQGDGSSGLSRGIIIVKIPARPYMQPVIDAYFGTKGRVRFQARVLALLGGDFGGPGATSANVAVKRSRRGLFEGSKGKGLFSGFTFKRSGGPVKR